MQRTSTPRSGKFYRSLAWYLVLLMIPFVLALGHDRSKATSVFPQEEVIPETLGFSENFDGVTAPALPNNWSSTASGVLVPFVTSNATPDTSPNSLFVPDPTAVGLSEIVTPPIQIGSITSHIIFRNNYATENTFDGGVLEIKIGVNDFQDIIQAGGSFVSGAYNSTISSSFLNPLAGRMAWTGTSGGYITTEVNLPAAALAHTVQFKWRMGTDNSVAATGWRIDGVLITNTITGENPNNIVIPDSGPALSYPSTVNISGLVGAVTNVVVVLNNFSHSAPDDVDVMLVAPGGRKIVLMSDAGGANAVNNLSLAFDDAAASSLPDNGPLVSGTFKPTNFEPGDSFPPPAPAGPPTGATLSALNGINANGIWSLYVVDDNGINAGAISGGWGLLLATNASACSLNFSSDLQVFPITGGSGSFDINAPFGCDWTASSIHSWITITSATSGTGGVATLSFDVAPNMLGGRTGIIRVSNSSQPRDFNVQQPSGCPFALSETTQQFAAAGGQGNVNVTAAGVCGWSATTVNSWITINSGAGSGDGMVSYTVAPNTTTAPRTGAVQIGARTLSINQARLLSGAKLFDFDGDGKSDVSVFRPSSATWYISQSSNGIPSAQQFGLSTDRLAPADYDGDNKVDIAVFRNGTWYLVRSSDSTFVAEQWGVTGDLPVPADYDGDNKADLAVYRSGIWYVKRSSDGQLLANQFGLGGDRPLPGDYDNDGKADFTVYRPGASSSAASFWYTLRSSDGGIVAQQFGIGEDVPVPADYDGDGATNFAVFRPSNGTWFTSQNIATNYGEILWGTNGDIPVAGDYDGDGKADVAVFRQGVWYIRLSTNGTMRAESWGTSGDVAIPSVFVMN